MVNHIRTLILNEKGGFSSKWGEFIPKEFSPVTMIGEEKMIHGIILGGHQSRDKRELGASFAFRLIYDDLTMMKISDKIDSRLTFEPRFSSVPGDGSFEWAEFWSPDILVEAIEGSNLLQRLFSPKTSPLTEDMLKVKDIYQDSQKPGKKLAAIAMFLALKFNERL